MKLTSIIFTLIFISSSIFSQETPPNAPEAPENPENPEMVSDTTKVSVGDTEFIVVKKSDPSDTLNIFDKTVDTDDDEDDDDNDFTYWSGVDLGFSGLLMENSVLDDNPWLETDISRSAVVGLNILEGKLRIFKNHLGINSGLGFTWQDFSFNDSLSLVNQNDTIMGFNSGDIKFEKNKLKTGYIKVPLLLEINTSKNKKKNVHIAAGLIGGWNFRSLLKTRTVTDGDKIKTKNKGDFNLSPWSLEATTRVGYGNLNLFATVSLTSLFEENKGPEVYPFTVGITALAF